MFRLEKRFTFEAAHHLPDHDGKCRKPHGHTWTAVVVVEGRELQVNGPKLGMLIDYGDISKVMKPILEQYLDHHDLTAEDLGREIWPMPVTSENLAAWLFYKLKPQLPLLKAVTIEETQTSTATYWERE